MKPVILLVDDEPDLLNVLADAIGHAMPAYEVIGSTSVDDAEEVLTDLDATESVLALVVVDHKLGERTGLEFIEALRVRFPDLPKILFTGQAPPTVEARALEAGARVLWKPIRLKTWLGEVQALLA